MPGPAPKPTALKKLEGNRGKRALNKKEPKTEGMPLMPDHLTERAKKAWFHLLPLLHKKGLAGDIDSIALERICETYAEVIELQQEIEDEGRTYKSKTESGGDMQRVNPKVAMLQDADRRLKGYLIEFGMTPAARSKVQIRDGEEEKDTEEEYFRNAG